MRINLLKKIVILSFLCGLFSFSLRCTADTVSTQFSREKVALGDTLTVTYTANNDMTADTPNFSALQNDFEILSTKYGSVVNMINGAVTKQTIWQLTLQPKKTGVIHLPPVQFGSDTSSPEQIVVEAASNTDGQKKSDAPVFLQAEVSDTKPYVQSQVIYKLKLFYQTRLDNPRIELPQTKEATFMELEGGNQYQTTVKGNSYIVLEKNIAVFPKKSGKLTIPATHFSAYITDSDTSLLNDHFYITEPKAVKLTTKEFILDVQKVPDTFQGQNWLPAKNLVLKEIWSVDTNQWEVGNPVTRTVILSAEGLRADQIPDFVFEKVDGVNLYVDPPKRTNQMKDNTVIGNLEQKVTYIPNTSQSFSLPALKLNWWNTVTHTNAIAQLNTRSIQIKAQVNNTSSPIVKMPLSSPVTNSNLSAKSSPDKKPQAVSFYQSLWFWVAAFFFIIWIVTLWLIWWKKPVKAKSNVIFSEPALAPINIAVEPDEKLFQQACEQGNPTMAQQYLLSWAKKEYQNSALTLEKLCELVNDDDFKKALQNLELTIYAKKAELWHGRLLFEAYQKLQKQRKQHASQNNKLKLKTLDPLPPLHPL